MIFGAEINQSIWAITLFLTMTVCFAELYRILLYFAYETLFFCPDKKKLSDKKKLYKGFPLKTEEKSRKCQTKIHNPGKKVEKYSPESFFFCPDKKKLRKIISEENPSKITPKTWFSAPAAPIFEELLHTLLDFSDFP